MAVAAATSPSTRALARRLFATLAVATLLLTTFLIAQPNRAGAADYPGLAEIQAAKAAVEDAKSDVAELDAAIIGLEEAAHQADAAARLAADEYAAAQAASDLAQQELATAIERSADAEAALERARADLGEIAMEAYRQGGNFGSLEAIMSADGFEDVIIRSEAIDRASVHADDTVQRVKAAELVAQTMREYAEQAALDAQEAADAAAQALAAAQEAQRNAEDALAQAQQTREAAIARLAELRNTSADLERQRQAGLQAERLKAEQELWEKLQREQQQGGSGGNPGGGSAGPGPDPAPGGGNPGGGNPGGGAQPSDPPPASNTGGWKSTAAQGQTAVNHALTLMGSPYQAGGEGPAYDCSGLTKVSWGVAGYYLPHSSKAQYAAVTKISYSELRPGDLIFWGTGRDANKIYHVAIYIGNGMVAEATVPGSPAKTRVYNNWAVGDLMPYAGRV